MRVERIVNGLPDRAYVEPSPLAALTDAVTIGWSGVAASHPHDLEVVGTALSDVLASDADLYVKIVGDGVWAADVLGVPTARQANTGRAGMEIGRASGRARGGQDGEK